MLHASVALSHVAVRPHPFVVLHRSLVRSHPHMNPKAKGCPRFLIIMLSAAAATVAIFAVRWKGVSGGALTIVYYVFFSFLAGEILPVDRWDGIACSVRGFERSGCAICV